jgi:hypothetical protein
LRANWPAGSQLLGHRLISQLTADPPILGQFINLLSWGFLSL